MLAGGRIGLEIALNDEMKRSHLLIDGMVLLTILIMCSLCFRSTLAAIMLTVPLVIANLGAFAYMCLMDIGLSVKYFENAGYRRVRLRHLGEQQDEQHNGNIGRVEIVGKCHDLTHGHCALDSLNTAKPEHSRSAQIEENHHHRR